MVRLQTLDLRIGVRVPASQPIIILKTPRIPAIWHWRSVTAMEDVFQATRP